MCGKSERAIAAFDEVQEDHPESPWAQTSWELTEAVCGFDASLAANADALLTVLNALRRVETDCFECKFVFTYDEGRKLNIYVALTLSTGAMDVAILEEDQPLFRYAVSGSGSTRVFVRDESAIVACKSKPIYLVPQLDVSMVDEQLKFTANANTVDSPDAMVAAKRAMAASEHFRSREEILTVLRQFTKGILPCTVARTDQFTSYTWLEFDPQNPALHRCEFRVLAAGNEIRMTEETSECTCCLRFGSQNQWQLDAPRWPDLPVVEKGEMDMGTLFGMFGAAAARFQSEQLQTSGNPVSRQ